MVLSSGDEEEKERQEKTKQKLTEGLRHAVPRWPGLHRDAGRERTLLFA